MLDPMDELFPDCDAVPTLQRKEKQLAQLEGEKEQHVLRPLLGKDKVSEDKTTAGNRLAN